MSTHDNRHFPKLAGLHAMLLPLLLGVVSNAASSSSSSSSSTTKLKSKSEYLVKGLEEIVPAYQDFDGDMYAGMIPVDRRDKERGEMMFWLFAPHEPAIKDTMVMWLNGGPGCSSLQCGNLYETGPVTVPSRPAGWCCATEDEPLVPNPHAWTRQTYMLFLEQPVGVGFSWGPMPETEDDVADDMVSWLHNFYSVFEELQRYDFHIFGESYAGFYAPAIARGIYHDNLQNINEADNPKINLQGIALGNGWIDVETQGPAVIDFALWHGMIDKQQRDQFMEEWKTCLYASPLSHTGEEVDDDAIQAPYHIFTTPDECGIARAILSAAGQGIWTDAAPNTYDVTTWDTYPVIGGANTTTLQMFFNDPTVQKSLNAPNVFWAGCIPGEGRRRQLSHLGRRRRGSRRNRGRQLQQEIPPFGTLMLDHDRPLSMLSYMAELLDEAKIRVLVYNADLDMSVCAQGSEAALNTMKWSGAKDWATQERGLWTTATQIDKVAGYAKETHGLTFLVVRNSGHMVPFNQPENGMDLMTRFLRNESYVDQVVPFYMSDPLPGSAREEANEAATDTVAPKDYPWQQHVAIYILLLGLGFGVGYSASTVSRRCGYQPVHGQ